MAKQSINIGSSANDGQGDALRTAFDKVNDNFTDLYEGGTNNVNVITIGKDTDVGGAITLTGSAVSQSGNTFTINTSAGQGNSGALQYNNGGDVAGANDVLYTSGILKVTSIIEARGDGTNAGKLKLYCESTSSPHAITIEGPAHSGASSYALKLPGSGPGSSQILQSDNSGQLAWINTPSGGSSLSIANNGSALATNATSINFVGNGVTASGTGATKTITIPGVGLSGQDDKKFLYNNSGSVASSSLLSLGTDEVLIGDALGDRGILRIEGSETASAYVKLEGTTATRGVILTVPTGINSDYTITFPDAGPSGDNKILQSNNSGELSWVNVPTGGTTYSASTGLALNGTAFSLATSAALTNLGGGVGTTTWLRKDGTWVQPPNTTYSVMGSGNSYAVGLVPTGNSTHLNQYLRKDGTFAALPGTVDGSPSGTGWGDSVRNIDMTSTGSGYYTALSTRVKSYQGHRHLSFYLNPSGTTTLQGSISQNSGAVNYNTTSDYRLKENVVEMTGAVDRVKQLKPSRFNWVAFPNVTVDGFLAHEAQAVVPEAVSGDKDQVDENGVIQPQGLDQSKLVPLLVGAIKELTARIEALEA